VFDEVGRAGKRANDGNRNPDDATVEFAQKIVAGLVIVNAAKDRQASQALRMHARKAR
jgi:hypothetical protein